MAEQSQDLTQGLQGGEETPPTASGLSITDLGNGYSLDDEEVINLEGAEEAPAPLQQAPVSKEVGVKAIDDETEEVAYKNMSDIFEMQGIPLEDELKNLEDPEFVSEIALIVKGQQEEIAELTKNYNLLVTNPSVEALLKFLQANPGRTLDDLVGAYLPPVSLRDTPENVIEEAVRLRFPSLGKEDLAEEVREITAHRESNPEKFERELKKLGISTNSNVLAGTNQLSEQQAQQERLEQEEAERVYVQTVNETSDIISRIVLPEGIEVPKQARENAKKLLERNPETGDAYIVEFLNKNPQHLATAALALGGIQDIIRNAYNKGGEDRLKAQFSKLSGNPITNSTGNEAVKTNTVHKDMAVAFTSADAGWTLADD